MSFIAKIAKKADKEQLNAFSYYLCNMRRFFLFISVLLPVAVLCACSEEPVTYLPQGQRIPQWLELPEASFSGNVDFYTHDCNLNGRRVRNYSFCWDYSARVSRWVAYPLDKSYLGNVKKYDGWRYDPLVPAAKQPFLISGYMEGNRGSYDRGLQLPNSHRSANGDLIETTFYSTNMVPLYKVNGEGVWAQLEKRIRSWAEKSDTLYVVSGCVTKGAEYFVYDFDRNKVTVPVAIYKAVLRYKKDSANNNGGYMGIAFWYDYKDTVESFSRKESMSIAELEKKLGYQLFVNLPAVTGETVAQQIKNENPGRVGWWWLY